MTPESRLERNLALYPVYAGGMSGFAWLPVFFLYFESLVSFDRVLQLEAIYYAAVVILEVPSGYFSDTVGRVATMRSAAVVLLLAYALFWHARDFLGLAAAQVLLAAGVSFNSGTDASFHYDTLSRMNRQAEFAKREASAVRVALVCTAAAAVLGGLAASVALGAAYVVAALFALVAAIVAFVFAEPRAVAQAGADRARGAAASMGASLAACAATLGRPSLRWLFGFAVLTTVLNHIPYELYQPYIRLVLADGGASARVLGSADPAGSVPIVTGVHAAVALLIAAFAAPWGTALQLRAGTARTLLVAACVQTLLIGVMGWLASAWAVGLVVLRSLPRGLASAPYRVAVLSRLPRNRRATWLSIESLAGRLAFAGYLALMSVVGGDTESSGGSAAQVLMMARTGFVIGAVGLASLWLCRDAVGERS